MNKKKKVSIIYWNPDNENAISSIRNNLEKIFGEYIDFTDCFLSDLEKGTRLQADAFLAVDEYIYEEVKEYIKDFDRIIKMNRSPSQEGLKKIARIPAGSNVLVVNDTYNSSVDTANTFNEIGISHINLIPFDAGLLHTGIYDNLSIAITPAEAHLVPRHIETVIDIGYRQVSFDTMFKLMKLLDLDIAVINRNLFRYMRSLVEPNNAFHANYIYGYLKSEMLGHIVKSSKIGMVLIDSLYQVVYANDKALQIFQANDNSGIRLEKHISPSVLTGPDSIAGPIIINGTGYVCDKYPLPLMDEIVGYYITLQDADDVAVSNKANRQKGYVAKYHFKDMVHDSHAMNQVIKTAQKIALTDYTVLIRGESGTGKELLAQSLHNASRRRQFPFVAINCAAFPDNLLESELFGYEPGAFTGAHTGGKIGLFEQANHGTIFLDEIGSISSKLQATLLRTIQERQIMRIGSDRVIDVDFRLITATNRDLEQAVQSGSFRSDLFFRLNVLPITIPPLRNRKEDVVPLLKYFLGNDFKNVSDSEIKRLKEYDWPGNVRELENMATYYKTLSVFPQYGQVPGREQASDGAGPGGVSIPVLKLIRRHTEVSHGIGRNALIQLLRDSGLKLSDSKLRDILSSLQEAGYIEIGRGRCGTRITDKGAAALSGK